jgi:hypothetical protein
MKIGLSFMTQIRGGDDPAALGRQPDRSTDRLRGLAGWIAMTFNQLVGAISTAYHTEHNDDDTHKTIHASGSIAERKRTTAMGDWIAVSYLATDFTASAGTWTVGAGDVGSFRYMLVGTTLTVAFYLETTSVSATPAALYLKVPGNFKIARQIFNTFAYDDNGVLGIGVAQVAPAAPTLIGLYNDVRGTALWAVAVNTTAVAGQISFEVVP